MKKKLLSFFRFPFSFSPGFTLMELLIVMVLLGILIAVVSGNFATSAKKGRDSRRKADLKNIATALEAYYSDKGLYPTSTVNGEIVGCGTNDSQVCAWGGEFKDKNGTLYMVLIPQDPASNLRYYYVSATGGSYQLYAKLENTLDQGVGVNQEGYVGTNCGMSSSVSCTYGIASSNTTP